MPGQVSNWRAEHAPAASLRRARWPALQRRQDVAGAYKKLPGATVAPGTRVLQSRKAPEGEEQGFEQPLQSAAMAAFCARLQAFLSAPFGVPGQLK